MSITQDLIVDTDTLFVDASADKVGIGTTTPDYPLEVKNSGFDHIGMYSVRNTIGYTTSISHVLHNSASNKYTYCKTRCYLQSGTAGSETSYYQIMNSVAGSLVECLRVDPSGYTKAIKNYNVAVGSTNHDCYMDSTGFFGKTYSSLRYKENVEDLGRDSEFIFDLRPVQFDYKDNGGNSQGLIAEEVAEVDGKCDNLLTYDDEDRPDSVNYSRLIPLMLNEIQKLREEVDELRELAGKVKKPKKAHGRKIKDSRPPLTVDEELPDLTDTPDIVVPEEK